MNWIRTSKDFAACIRSPMVVRDAFLCHRQFHWLWLAILFLHGKHVQNDATPACIRMVVADGFVFYAKLYRALSIILSVLLLAFGVLSEESDMSAYVVLAVGSWGFLWAATSLGLRGAKAYRIGLKNGRTALVIFVTLLTWFLIAFAAGLSSFVYYHRLCSFGANITAVILFVVIGVGSYCIELIYMASVQDPEADTKIQQRMNGN